MRWLVIPIEVLALISMLLGLYHFWNDNVLMSNHELIWAVLLYVVAGRLDERTQEET